MIRGRHVEGIGGISFRGMACDCLCYGYDTGLQVGLYISFPARMAQHSIHFPGCHGFYFVNREVVGEETMKMSSWVDCGMNQGNNTVLDV